jgi:hypothetical protein
MLCPDMPQGSRYINCNRAAQWHCNIPCVIWWAPTTAFSGLEPRSPATHCRVLDVTSWLYFERMWTLFSANAGASSTRHSATCAWSLILEHMAATTLLCERNATTSSQLDALTQFLCPGAKRPRNYADVPRLTRTVPEANRPNKRALQALLLVTQCLPMVSHRMDHLLHGLGPSSRGNKP